MPPDLFPNEVMHLRLIGSKENNGKVLTAKDWGYMVFCFQFSEIQEFDQKKRATRQLELD